jgi:hypothetical protein
MKISRRTGALPVILAALLLVAGCNQNPGSKEAKSKDAQAKAKPKDDKDAGETRHSSWWCEEHGVPEHMCSLCSSSVAAKLKKAGDWCKIHDRAQSQCFKCDPSKYAKYEAMYEAKYGKKPPRPPEEEFQN